MHIPVLLEEAVGQWGALEKNGMPREGVYIDATFGEGGHTKKLLSVNNNQKIKIIGLDLDEARIKKGKEKFKKEIEDNKVYLISQGFQNIKKVIEELREKEDFQGLPVLGVIFDLGMCSTQLEENRGFSFNEREAPLDMRFDKNASGTLKASDILNSFSKGELEKIIREFGEERHFRKVASEIIKKRLEGEKFEKVKDIYSLLENTISRYYRKYRIHFATRTFQALRIAVNGERENIEKGLEGAKEILSKGGRIAVISFHSGEDRMVKRFFKYHQKECVCPESFPVCQCNHKKTFRIITKKPIIPSENEILINPRARSAKLRSVEKII